MLASCATPYTPTGPLGGFAVKELRDDVYRVSFRGNGYTTSETAQTYWLYHAAELTLEKGYYGFEVLTEMRFVLRRAPDDVDPATMRARIADGPAMRLPDSPEEFAQAAGWRPDAAEARDGLAGASHIRIARYSGGTFVYVPGTYGLRTAGFEGDIHLLKTPFEPAPPKLFAAKSLKTALEPHMKSEKCGMGNVCPHVHEYLLPRGTLQRR